MKRKKPNEYAVSECGGEISTKPAAQKTAAAYMSDG